MILLYLLLGFLVLLVPIAFIVWKRSRVVFHGNKTVLITGGTKGIGYELACICRREGHEVVVVSRNPIPGDTKVITADLSTLEGVEKVSDYIRLGDVDVLVNNAAMGSSQLLVDEESSQAIVFCNLTAPLLLAKAFLQSREEGNVLNVSSAVAYSPIVSGNNGVVYGSTKAALAYASEALDFELRSLKKKIRVQYVCPGATDTYMFREMVGRRRGFEIFKPKTPQEVARSIYKGLFKDQCHIVEDVGTYLALKSAWLFVPRWIMGVLLRWFNHRLPDFQSI